MAQPVATVEELQARLPFTMDEDEKREASGALEDLSDEARSLGKTIWRDPNSTPRSVRNLVLKAVARHMKNYDGFIQSRAGDEQLTWTDRGEDAGSAYFTAKERATLQALAGNQGGGFHSVGTYVYGRGDAARGRLVRDEDGFLMPIYVPGTEFIE